MNEEQEQSIENENVQADGPPPANFRYAYALSLLVIIFFAVGVLTTPKEKEENKITITDVAEEDVQVINPFDEVVLSARAAFVYDVEHREILFAYNEEHQLPLASLTKLMTVLVATDTFSSPTTVVEIDQSAIEREGDSGLKIGERWNLADLISFTLVSSSNDGASAIANAVNASDSVVASIDRLDQLPIISKMNGKAREIGMAQTFFINETGLDTTLNVGGSYGSARDTALLFEYILRNHSDIIESTREITAAFVSLDDALHEITNTNTSIGNIPGFIGGKTGFTDLAGGNLVVAFHAGLNRPIIISVLGSTLEGRFKDVEQLVAASFKYLAQ